MEKEFREEIENEILVLIQDSDDYAQSDLQAAVSALVRRIELHVLADERL